MVAYDDRTNAYGTDWIRRKNPMNALGVRSSWSREEAAANRANPIVSGEPVTYAVEVARALRQPGRVIGQTASGHDIIEPVGGGRHRVMGSPDSERHSLGMAGSGLDAVTSPLRTENLEGDDEVDQEDDAIEEAYD